MKTATISPLALGLFIIPFIVLCFASPPQQALAQETVYEERGPLEPAELYSREELTQMLAPIALYPDALLAQVLMASTYPIEVIEADRWRRNVKHLEGNALDAALLDKDWAPSVKTMCHFPSILALMSERIGETTNLGNAFLAQEEEVMAVVQELRAKAYAQGNLATTEQQKVVVEKETIIIEPADPQVVYVPYYDPFYVYGPWWYPAYPPYYWGPTGVSIGIGISYWPGFYFGFVFGDWWYFDWHHHHIYINVHKRPRYVRHDRWFSEPGRWHHHPRHRRGVAYRDKFTARKYGQYPRRHRDYRRDTRGFPERRDRDRDRTAIDRDRVGDERTRFDRDRQMRERTERERRERQRIDRDRRDDDRTRIDRDRQERERMERDRQQRERVDRDRQQRERAEREQRDRQRIERDRQQRERADRDRQMRERADRDRQERQRVERERQMRQRADQERQTRQGVERERQQRRRDNNVFNRVEDGRRERQSSERGRFSRERRDDDSRSRGRSNRDDRDDRGRRGR